MNKIMREYWPTFKMYRAIRDQILAVLTDEQLDFRPAEGCESIGELLLDLGQTQVSYVQSFQTGSMQFGYQHSDQAVHHSTAQLAAWYAELDEQLEGVISAFSDEELAQKTIDRGGGFVLPVLIHLDIFKEALLIFYGKMSVNLKVMGEPLPEQMAEWIG